MGLIEIDCWFLFIITSINEHLFVGAISSCTSPYVQVLSLLSSAMPPKCNLEKVCAYIWLNEWMLNQSSILDMLSILLCQVCIC